MATTKPITTERKTSLPIPFRYKKEDGKEGTTKFTISLDIFGYLVSAFEDSEKEAKKWLVSKAKMHKQAGVKNLSAYIREECLMIIIEEGLLDSFKAEGKKVSAYEIEPKYQVVSSSYYDEDGNIAYIPINIPASMIHALAKQNIDFQELIDTKHRYYRGVQKSNPDWVENNISETIRQDILADMVDQDLISVEL